LDINRSAKFPYTRLSEVKQQSPVELDIGSNIGSNYSDNSEFENADDSDTDPDYVQSSDDDNETEDSFGEDDDTDCEIDRKRSRSTCVDGDTSAKTSNKSQVKACDHTKSYLLKHRVTSSHETNAESRLQSDLSVGNNENLYEAQEQNDNLNENENSNEAEQQNDDNVNENQKPTSSITVARSHKTRVFDKRPHCYYCGVQQSQVQRHWLTKHSTEREVIEIDMCKDRNKKWRLIARLRNLGNHFHNVEVIRAGKGELMVTHRKSSEVEALNYVPCDQCYAYVLKRELWRHKCKFGKPDKGRKISSAQLLLPAPSNVQPEVHELLSSMKDDNVRFLAKCDGLIVEYAKKMIHVKGMKKKFYIRDKVREITRFLIQVRTHEGMETVWLKDCISPQYFSTCLSAVKELAGFDKDTAQYRTPSLVLKVGHTLKKMAKLLKRQATEERMYHCIADIDYFHDLCESEWGDEIARHALDTLRHNKRNQVNLLPVASDVKKVVSYVRETSVRCCEALRSALAGECTDVQKNWRELAEVTLADVIIFNRRRSGEVAQLTIEDYNRRTTVDASSDVHGGLSMLEQNVCKLFSRIELRGKRDGIVPLLVTEHVRSAIDLLVESRSSAGVKMSNQYVFALSHSENYIRGSDAVRKAAVHSGAANPSTLTSTNFRKHIATLSQLIDLKDHELDALAQFMGHDIRVHRKFYRLPNDVVQMSQLAKIFILMEKGQLAMHKGKTLEELMSEVTEDSGNISEHLSIKDIHIEGEERVVSKVDKCVDMGRGYFKPQWTSISCTIIEPLTIYSCLTLSLQ